MHRILRTGLQAVSVEASCTERPRVVMTATEGPIAVITGAGSDIGPATAQLFLERGYSIVPRFYRRVPSNG